MSTEEVELGNRCDVQCRYRYQQLQKEPGFDAKRSIALEKVKGIVVAPQPKATAKRRMKLPSYAPTQPIAMNMTMPPNIFMGLAPAPFFQQPVIGPPKQQDNPRNRSRPRKRRHNHSASSR
jgi:hypothetical protein